MVWLFNLSFGCSGFEGLAYTALVWSFSLYFGSSGFVSLGLRSAVLVIQLEPPYEIVTQVSCEPTEFFLDLSEFFPQLV